MKVKELKPGYKKILGILAIILGFIALITPFTPGAFWLLFIGLELIGVNILFLSKIEERLRYINSKIKDKFKRKKKEGL
ncbi:MAG: hypothetical protein A2639_02940 [Candidatus Staskawiczbacteria bacterium RIFCSPHIGHO2_01_FULL_34_27]|uniref:Uncharacterized protein n=2 Tax=Candidatus Staskawicziibacteriota TaxID=1817916 RepID=A0A1G2HKK4_9BACT|nr:MAG: hypothetical protein A2639_02940 [Candidatus Staskawiczbacteria bacterium RIFCSPHIGHO2_01_FULL_34_27]OGZ69307.1 MAG: hypothetical protein A3D35_00615 [Candidatus Staskawiczbacteria bacterium RIFCSPHIGHO2_02_FULL_34_9]